MCSIRNCDIHLMLLSAYGFYVLENGLDYDSVPHYSTLTVTCVENKVTTTATVTGNIQVYVTENQPPTITNLDGITFCCFLQYSSK